MNDWQWKKRAELVKQLEFFGVKKLTFISEYAKKPRVLIKAKAEAGYDAERYRFGWDDPRGEDERLRGEDFIKENIRNSRLSALYGQQQAAGIQNSQLGYGQMELASRSMAMGQSQFGSGFGGLAVLGSQLTGGRFI